MESEREKLRDMFRTLLRVRRFEERLVELFPATKVPGFIMSAIGQEAIPVGAIASLRTDDYVVGTHRGHGYLIAKGGKIDKLMAEIFGKRTGYCKGKGGPMHIAALEVNYLGGQAVVGPSITIATGCALSAKMRGTDQVTLSFFGDGASNTGRFHEGVNLGSIWKLPVIYICENNLYATTVAQRESMVLKDVASRASAYGIPGIIVDGNDVLAVHRAVSEAVKRARDGAGPMIVECKTYRLRGHYEGDPETYRTKEEVDEWWRKEPVRRFRDHLIEQGILTDNEVEEMNRDILNEIDQAVRFAEESPFPSPEETLDDVYV